MKNTMISTAIALAIGLSAAQLHAQVPANDSARSDTRAPQTSHMNHSPVQADDFVEEASAKGLAEINTARLAMEEGSPAVQAYATKMIEVHTATNNELKVIAARSDLEVADDATLMDRARALVLSVREGDSFDEAYIENQIAAHENAIELYERAAISEHPEVSAFARQKLPTLHEHLTMAQALRTQLSSL